MKQTLHLKGSNNYNVRKIFKKQLRHGGGKLLLKKCFQ